MAHLKKSFWLQNVLSIVTQGHRWDNASIWQNGRSKICQIHFLKNNYFRQDDDNDDDDDDGDDDNDHDRPAGRVQFKNNHDSDAKIQFLLKKNPLKKLHSMHMNTADLSTSIGSKQVVTLLYDLCYGITIFV